MRTEVREGQLRELDETAAAFRLARRVARSAEKGTQGWLRTVRQAVRVPVAEAAGRMGLTVGEIFRMEMAEGRGVIELNTLRKAAEALGCELVYGLTPKDGTLAAMAAGIEAEREKRRAEAWAQKLEKAKEQRRAAAKTAWKKRERNRVRKEWRKYWQNWCARLPNLYQMRHKPMPKLPYWVEEMRKTLKKELRKKGVRVK